MECFDLNLTVPRMMERFSLDYLYSVANIRYTFSGNLDGDLIEKQVIIGCSSKGKSC